jgi:hypothetical protein
MLIGQITHQDCGSNGGSKDVLVIQTFVSHVFGEGSSIGRQTGNAYGHVIVNFQQLFLMRRKFAHVSFQGPQDDVRVATQADASGTLFDGFHGVFDLQENERERRCMMLLEENGGKLS